LCEPIQLIGQLPGVSKGEHISRHSLSVEIVTSPLAATPIFFWTSRITELNPIRSWAEEGVSLRAICGFFQSFGENPLQIRSSDGFREMIKCPKFYDLNGIGTIGKSVRTMTGVQALFRAENRFPTHPAFSCRAMLHLHR